MPRLGRRAVVDEGECVAPRRVVALMDRGAGQHPAACAGGLGVAATGHRGQSTRTRVNGVNSWVTTG